MSDQTPTGDSEPKPDPEPTAPGQEADHTTVMDHSVPVEKEPRSFGTGVLAVVAGLALLVGLGVGVLATNIYSDDDPHGPGFAPGFGPGFGWGGQDRDGRGSMGPGGWGNGNGWGNDWGNTGPGWGNGPGSQDGWRDETPPWGQDSGGGYAGPSDSGSDLPSDTPSQDSGTNGSSKNDQKSSKNKS